MARFPEGATDTGFVITLVHTTGAHSHVSSSKLNHLSSRELRIHGEHGSYPSNYTDVQLEALRRASARRASQHMGVGARGSLGIPAVADRKRLVPALRGDYTDLYDAFGEAVMNGGQGPVPAADGIAVLEILDAARESAARQRTSLSDLSTRGREGARWSPAPRAPDRVVAPPAPSHRRVGPGELRGLMADGESAVEMVVSAINVCGPGRCRRSR